MAKIRLDKWIASTGIASRKEVKLYAKQGRISVNGTVVRSAEEKLDPETETVLLDGKTIVYQEFTYVMMHKPAGVLSATEDKREKTVLDLLPPEYREVVKGHAEIKAIYDIGKIGKIAGSQMLDGKLIAKEKFRILRSRSQVWDGKVQTLRHFKDEVKEVAGQQECGVCFENYEGFQAGDVIECYQLEELPRSL